MDQQVSDSSVLPLQGQQDLQQQQQQEEEEELVPFYPVGTQIYKCFPLYGWFWGVIAEVHAVTTATQIKRKIYYEIMYNDDDSETLEQNELSIWVSCAIQHRRQQLRVTDNTNEATVESGTNFTTKDRSSSGIAKYKDDDTESFDNDTSDDDDSRDSDYSVSIDENDDEDIPLLERLHGDTDLSSEYDDRRLNIDKNYYTRGVNAALSKQRHPHQNRLSTRIIAKSIDTIQETEQSVHTNGIISQANVNHVTPSKKSPKKGNNDITIIDKIIPKNDFVPKHDLIVGTNIANGPLSMMTTQSQLTKMMLFINDPSMWPTSNNKHGNIVYSQISAHRVGPMHSKNTQQHVSVTRKSLLSTFMDSINATHEIVVTSKGDYNATMINNISVKANTNQSSIPEKPTRRRRLLDDEIDDDYHDDDDEYANYRTKRKRRNRSSSQLFARVTPPRSSKDQCLTRMGYCNKLLEEVIVDTADDFI